MEISRLTRDGTGLPNPSREANFSGANADREKMYQVDVSFSADHEQDWKPYPVDPYSVRPVSRITNYFILTNRAQF